VSGAEQDGADGDGVDGGEQILVITRHRDHRFPGRGRRITVRLDDAEHAAVVLAAGRAGLTPTGVRGGGGVGCGDRVGGAGAAGGPRPAEPAR